MKAQPFHAGELAAQRLAGEIALGHGIRDHMPEQHRSFFAALPFVLLASAAPDGAPRAQVLHGAPGFIASPDPLTLTLTLACGSASALTLAPGAQVGLLGIDFATRRRNRANGVVRSNDAGLLVIAVHESFGNCPKHITLRDLAPPRPMPIPAPPPAVTRFAGLDAAARALVGAADTFFVASSGGAHGLDVSHRGGPPGFARIEGDTLVIPDYSGNRYFNTLGNLLLDARAALLFIDFAGGDVLTLHGRVTLDLARRSWRFDCAEGALARAALPLRWQDR
jgi:predicted pyridoxine 5'-phosphate oxidase superfamily flavin-nucleotide-binding protein